MFEFQGHSGEPLRFPSKFVYGHSRCSSLRISQNLSSARHIYEVTEVWISRSFGWAPAISVKIGIRTYYILLITNIIKVKLGPPYFSSYGVTKLRNFKVIRRAPPIFVKICMRTHYMLLITLPYLTVYGLWEANLACGARSQRAPSAYGQSASGWVRSGSGGKALHDVSPVGIQPGLELVYILFGDYSQHQWVINTFFTWFVLFTNQQAIVDRKSRCWSRFLS